MTSPSDEKNPHKSPVLRVLTGGAAVVRDVRSRGVLVVLEADHGPPDLGAQARDLFDVGDAPMVAAPPDDLSGLARGLLLSARDVVGVGAQLQAFAADLGRFSANEIADTSAVLRAYADDLAALAKRARSAWGTCGAEDGGEFRERASVGGVCCEASKDFSALASPLLVAGSSGLVQGVIASELAGAAALEPDVRTAMIRELPSRPALLMAGGRRCGLASCWCATECEDIGHTAECWAVDVETWATRGAV